MIRKQLNEQNQELINLLEGKEKELEEVKAEFQKYRMTVDKDDLRKQLYDKEHQLKLMESEIKTMTILRKDIFELQHQNEELRDEVQHWRSKVEKQDEIDHRYAVRNHSE